VFSFGEIRAFTSSEIATMQAALASVDATIAREFNDVLRLQANPLNYVFGTQRDNIARLSSVVDQHERVRNQLRNTMSSVIESGDTDKLAKWLGLASSVNLVGWSAAVDAAKTSTVVTETAKETAKDLGKIAGIGTTIALVGAGLYLLIAFGPRRK